jgi:hypothetical protein
MRISCRRSQASRSATAQPVIKGLRHRGGLRAQILSEGTIHVGDVIRVDHFLRDFLRMPATANILPVIPRSAR